MEEGTLGEEEKLGVAEGTLEVETLKGAGEEVVEKGPEESRAARAAMAAWPLPSP